MPRRLSHDVLGSALAAMVFVLGYAAVRDLSPPHRSTARVRRATDQGLAAAGGWRRWRAILKETWRRSDEDRLLAVAAGVVFYGLLALFPAITAMVSLYGLLADPRTIHQHLSLLAGVVPAGVIDVVDGELLRVAAKSNANLGVAFAVSLLLALWSANGGMKAMIDALNAVSEHRETRGFVRLNATALGLTLGALVAAIVAVTAVVALPLLLAFFGNDASSDSVLQLARWPALVLLILLGLSILYRFAPVAPARWRLFSVGAVVATVLWLAGSAALSVYLARFANYSATYGSLGAAIGLMMWMWMSSIVVLLGAELNSVVDAVRTGTDGDAAGFAPTEMAG